MQRTAEVTSRQPLTTSHSFILLQKDVALAVRPSCKSWSCIVFATRKLATLAIEAVLRAAPSLGFLMTTPFMGYGGDTSAASMHVKVGQLQRLTCDDRPTDRPSSSDSNLLSNRT